MTDTVAAVPITQNPLSAYVAVVASVAPFSAYGWQGVWTEAEELLGFYANVDRKKARASLEQNAPVSFQIEIEVGHLLILGLTRITFMDGLQGVVQDTPSRDPNLLIAHHLSLTRVCLACITARVEPPPHRAD